MILLTGASGFIGKHLLKRLVENHGKKHVISLTSKPINECNYLLHNNYKFETDFFHKNGFNEIEIVIHAGAFTPKSGKEADNISLSNSNIINTQNLLNVLPKTVKRFIFLSTIDVYNNDGVLSENSLEKPISLYGYSKLYCEKMIKRWGNQNNIPIQLLRIGHVYGPGEEEYQKIIPTTIKKILSKKAIKIWGDGNELRSFIYISDLVLAIQKSTDLKGNIGVVNLVGDNAISINELVHKIDKISEKKNIIERVPNKFPGRDLVFNNSKMKKYLLNNFVSLEKGLLFEFKYMLKKYKI
jgi:nucleoside-diphosphate-sugar epimerase